MRDSKIPILLILVLISFLTACATMPASHPPYNQSMSWQARKQQLTRVKSWQIRGALAVKTPKQSGMAYINWQQKNRSYQMHIFGPLGVASTMIDGKPGHVTLQTSHGTLSARTPENLLHQELGWFLPVSNLYYWIRGLPVPHKKTQKQFDRYHHLTKLKQQGWQIEYLRYTGVKQQDLPSKMRLIYPNLTLQIVISSWYGARPPSGTCPH